MKSYTSPPTPLRLLREQFRLFAFDGSPLPTSEISARFSKDFSKREILIALLEGELNFYGEDSGYASHDFHSYAAKFPPQLPRIFIHALTYPGEFIAAQSLIGVAGTGRADH